MTREVVKEALDGLIAAARRVDSYNVAAQIDAVERAVDQLVVREVAVAVASARQMEHTRRVERVAGQILAARFAAAGHGGLWGEEDVKVAYHAADMLIDYINKNERRG